MEVYVLLLFAMDSGQSVPLFPRLGVTLMEAYAVVDTGGKQYLVKVGEQVSVELLAQGDAKQVTLDRVLALSDGKELKIGAPVIKGAKVTADVIRDYRSPKLVSFKKKRRKGYSRKIGHRQEQTLLKIVSIA